ncbi:tRNA (adenosine(37)-N6)-threonylcarbamoyltransferase complex dimerization subunit type 1 TsaB [bacterium]|nr:MAG: tRNA (adenosine(37)-N6)-threonylcarbamoyltransferase complex dimerization subunit type 1 TsaB [bacterium]
MLILAIDGALGPFTAAVLESETGKAWIEAAAQRDALEGGLRAADAALRSSGYALDDLHRLAVTVGPGGFTGLRIALAYAKSLAFALNLPLVGVSSYDALAPRGLGEPALVAVRGRAGAACVRLRLVGGSEERFCGAIDEVAEWVGSRASGAELAVAGALDELAPALVRAGVPIRRLVQGEPPALRAAHVAATAALHEGAHGVRPDYGERPHTTVPR